MLISKPYTFSQGTTIIASEHNSNFDTLYQDYNGGITNANLSAGAAVAYSKLALTNGIVNGDINSSAAIADSKLATISTAGKVSGAALTSLTSVPSGAGVLPVANSPAIDTLLPTQTGNSGKFLTTNGSVASWGNAGIPYSAGSLVEVTAGTERKKGATARTTYTKMKALTPLARSGTVTVSFDMKSGDANWNCYGKIYVNDIAVGTERATKSLTYVSFTENINVASGDVVSIYGKFEIDADNGFWDELKLLVSNPTTVLEASGY